MIWICPSLLVNQYKNSRDFSGWLIKTVCREQTKLTNLDIVVAVRGRCEVDLGVDIVIDIVSVGDFCNKIVKFVFDLKGKNIC